MPPGWIKQRNVPRRHGASAEIPGESAEVFGPNPSEQPRQTQPEPKQKQIQVRISKLKIFK